MVFVCNGAHTMRNVPGRKTEPLTVLQGICAAQEAERSWRHIAMRPGCRNRPVPITVTAAW